MGKRREQGSGNKRAYKPKPPFRTVEGIESLAYKRLSPNDVFVLLELYRKFNGYNRADLSLTAKDISGRMSSATFSKSIWRLIAYGFIDIKRRGAMKNECSIYGFSGRWRKLEEADLKKVSILLNRLERIKRITGGKNDPKIKHRKKMLREGIKNRMLGQHWKFIRGYKELT